jgi:radical SAM superfamily enzyme YgiQ (UPF0313 family)
MDRIGEPDFTHIDLISHLTGLDASKLNKDNYLEFLKPDLSKERHGILEHFGMENYSSTYIANQISKADRDAKVFIADGRRLNIKDIIIREGKKPEAVFISSMSSNFPTAVATAIPLNYAGIPVVIGGIHVSTSDKDMETYIKQYIPNTDIVSMVIGAGDSEVISRIISDIKQDDLQIKYTGFQTMEDGIWGSKNVYGLPEMKLTFLKKLPIAGNILKNKCRLNVTTPYIGCPFSCNFCSISTLSKKNRKFMSRNPDDFINELKNIQKNSNTLKKRFFFFLPDNLMLGGKHLIEILDKIIENNLKLNYAVQVSVDVAKNKDLLSKLRLSGASHFFIGFESLDIRNLEYLGKHSVNDIKRTGLSVSDYYSRHIKTIIDQGISIHGAFITGLPFDYFNDLEHHTGRDIAEFCKNNKIGIQPAALSDLPGSINFRKSQDNGSFLYGRPGTMDYLLALCITDLSEMNRKVPSSLKSSPLVAAYMAWETARIVGSNYNAVNSAMHMAKKAWISPTWAGRRSIKDRMVDALSAIVFQLGVSVYKDVGDSLALSRNGKQGTFERLYASEKNSDVKKIFRNYIDSIT